MDKCVMTLPVLLLFLGLVVMSQSCLEPASAYRFTGAVCRLTYPAAVVLNEKTTKVIQAAFQHAKYPSISNEKSILFVGKVKYGLANLEIHNLSIGRSEFELIAGEGIEIAISNVSAVFKGTIQYGYGSWLVNVGHSVDFEIDSHIDLGINPKLYCGKGKVAADTSDCYLTFHKLDLLLQGDREPGWLKRLFTNFITFTVKLVIKSQICKEINNVANILADFIQERAEQFLSDGDISMDIGVTSAPVITSNYIESYHKGLAKYNNMTAVINESVFDPSQLTDDRMLYFWISDEVFNPLITAAHQDRCFVLNISGLELTELFKTNLSTPIPEFLSQFLSSEEPVLRVWSVSVPHLWTTPMGTYVRAVAAAELTSGAEDIPGLYFEMEMVVVVTASYAKKKLILIATTSQISIMKDSLSTDTLQMVEAHIEYLKEAVEKIGVPKVISKLEPSLTALLDKQGTNLFDLIEPQVVSQDGFVIIQTDFAFPHHLLVEFLRKTLE
ncbi:cholesteryl ester transfer protein [Oncorhynchus tshawytscha]|uniref:Cholesteryl ester transfer protein n=1 Tax=Oncorhynchus tshawytscha TaxID=74940 RepID=A0A8C8EPG0_ONCTS|nr:cholesteryl ester transfer protein [Oncorhynchus tshawytscha]